MKLKFNCKFIPILLLTRDAHKLNTSSEGDLLPFLTIKLEPSGWEVEEAAQSVPHSRLLT